MSNVNIFNNPTKTVPRSDPQIIRVNMEEQEIGGRKSHLPPRGTSGARVALAQALFRHALGAAGNQPLAAPSVDGPSAHR